MVNEIMAFTNEVFGSVRATKIDEKVWFFGKDVIECLGYDLSGNSYTVFIKRHCDEEDYVLVDSKTQVQNILEFDYKQLGQRGGYLINEYGVIDLVLGSPLPQAKAFKKWITHEVIPSVLQTGSYNVPQISKKQQCVLTMFDDNATEYDKVIAMQDFGDISRGEACQSVITLDKVEELVIESLKNEDDIVLHMSRLQIREIFHKTLYRLGYITYQQFQTKDKKRLERVWTKVPTNSFYEVFADRGLAVVREITTNGDDRGKVEITYTRFIVKWLQTEQFKQTYLKIAHDLVLIQ